MNDFIGSTSTQFALLTISWALMARGLWKLAERADSRVSPEGKRRTRDWLRASGDGSSQAMADSFAQAFDAVFSNKCLSWTCFRRSVAASFFFTAILCVLWVATHPVLAGFGSDISGFQAITTVVVVMLALSSVPDYVSLLKTRFVVAALRRSRNPFTTVMLVVADAAGSAALGTLAIYALAVIGAREHFSELTLVDLLRDLLDSNLDLVGLGGATLPLDLWFYATFLTSLWLWLFVLSKHIVRASDSHLAGSTLRRWFDVDRQPFLALGAGSILIVTIACFVVVPFVMLQPFGPLW
jgi:hypothetical protein